MTRGVKIKTPEEIKIMAEGGKILGNIRDLITADVQAGIPVMELEKKAITLIRKAGGEPSFKMVPGYHHATCINLNDVVVHGIPDMTRLKEGDKVGIDVGLYYKGFHTDTAITIFVGKGDNSFLETGKQALKKAIEQTRPGKRVADISLAIQKTVEGAKYNPVKALTGHGVGRNLHEEPAIPCFVADNYQYSPLVKEGMVLAIEVMYNTGVSDVVYKNDDGWTIATADGKISGLFEQTVAVTKSGPVILTSTEIF